MATHPDPSSTAGGTTELDEAIADLAVECRLFLLATAAGGEDVLKVGVLANELHFAAMEVHTHHLGAARYVGWLATAADLDPPDDA